MSNFISSVALSIVMCVYLTFTVKKILEDVRTTLNAITHVIKKLSNVKEVLNTMSKQSNFINAIAPLCVNEYLKRKKWVLPSVAIAQASLESGWNINAKTLYGIKGKGITSVTKEEINGRLIPTTANFKVYPNIAESVKGYYDLITSSERYKKAVNNPDYKNTIIAIHNGGYATDSQYSHKIIKIIEQYNLTVYDVPRVYATSSEKDKNTITSVALDVINGKYGNGTERKIKLTQAGYDYRTIQNKVNQILRGGK